MYAIRDACTIRLHCRILSSALLLCRVGVLQKSRRMRRLFCSLKEEPCLSITLDFLSDNFSIPWIRLQ